MNFMNNLGGMQLPSPTTFNNQVKPIENNNGNLNANVMPPKFSFKQTNIPSPSTPNENIQKELSDMKSQLNKMMESLKEKENKIQMQNQLLSKINNQQMINYPNKNLQGF